VLKRFYTALLIKDRRSDTPWWNFSEAILYCSGKRQFLSYARRYIVYTNIVSDFMLPPRRS